MKAGLLVNIAPAITTIYKTDLPFNVSFRLMKVIPDIDKAVVNYNIQKDAMCKKYGTLSEDGQRYEFKNTDEFQAADLFQQDFNALNNEEIDITLPKILAYELEKANGGAGIRVSAEVLKSIYGIMLFDTLDDIPPAVIQ